MKQRIEYIDFFRGIGIILMVMCHVGFGITFYKFCHAFHMPMFFVITGYFFKFCALKQFICKKAKTLLAPYCTFGALQYMLWFGLHISDSYDNKLLHLKSFLFSNTDGYLVGGALWFLTSLFFAEMIYYFLNKLSADNKMILSLACLLVGIFGSIYPQIVVYRLPWGIDSALVGVLLIHIGFLFRTTSMEKCLNLKWKSSVALFVLGSVVALFNGSVNMRTMKYSNPIFFWLGLLLLTISLWNLCRLIINYVHKHDLFTFIRKVIASISYVGKNSIVYVCLNQFFISVVSLLIDLNASVYSQVLIFILVMILLRVSVEILSVRKTRIVIGRF